MAIAQTPTILPLDTFARILGINPLFFNSVQYEGQPVPHIPNGWFTQYSWQGADKIGREEIAEAIANAEQQMAQELHFWPGSKWEASELHRFDKPANTVLLSVWGTNPRGQWQDCQLDWGYFRQGGLETLTRVQATVPVIYSDLIGNGYKQTATITTAVPVPTGTVASEIEIYYPGAVGSLSADMAQAPAMPIRPTTVSINATTGIATIICRREQLVNWDILASDVILAPAADGAVDANFLGTVDVYRHWTDPSQQVVFRWEADGALMPFVPGSFCFNCGTVTGGSSTGVCPACEFLTQEGCIRGRDYRLGFVSYQPGTWNTTVTPNQFDVAFWAGCRQPDMGVFNYLHGPTENRLVSEAQRCVAYLAISKLRRELAEYDSLEPWSKFWGEDKTLVSTGTNSGDGRFQVSPRTTDNPLGGTRAAEYVWRFIQKHKIGRAAVLA